MSKVIEKIYVAIGCRVSDPLQLKGGSLDDQEVMGRMLAERNGWEVVKVFKNPHSATTLDREDIDEVVRYVLECRARGIIIKYYIFKCIDRFTRGGYPEYLRLEKMLAAVGVQIIDTYGLIQPNKSTLEHLGDFDYGWNVYSPSEAAVMLATYGGKQEVRDILTRMVGAEIRLAQQGWAVRRAPDGLKNKKVKISDTKERCVREANPSKVKFFQDMLEMRAKGVDDNEIVSVLNAQGFRTNIYKKWDRSNKENPREVGKRGGKKLTVKQLQRYIQQTEYAGIVCEKWTHYRAVRCQQFSGIVSIETFNLANRGKKYIRENADGTVEVLYNYSPYGKVKRLRNNPEYAFKFISCSMCHKPMLGSAPRGKSGKVFPRYHCGGTPSRNHTSFSVPKMEFEENIRHYVQSLRFDSDFMNAFELVLNDTYRTREKEVVQQSANISLNVANLKAEQAAALEALTKTESAIARKKLDEKIDELEKRIEEAHTQRQEIEINERDIKSFVRYVKAVMEHPAEMLIDTDDLRAQRTLFGLVFEEMPTYQEILNGTPKLSLVFRLSSEYEPKKNQLVTPRGIEPRFKA